MKYGKTVILTIILLSLFTAGCLVGTYAISKNIENMDVPISNKQIREGLQKRFEVLNLNYSNINKKSS